MASHEQVEKKFQKFLNFCRSCLGSDDDNSGKIKQLIAIRFSECSSHFKYSSGMLKLIKVTKSNMKAEPKRNMVHLKDFLQELKAYAKKRKRKDGGGSRLTKLRKTDDNASEASSTESVLSDVEWNVKPNENLGFDIESNSSSSCDMLVTCSDEVWLNVGANKTKTSSTNGSGNLNKTGTSSHSLEGKVVEIDCDSSDKTNLPPDKSPLDVAETESGSSRHSGLQKTPSENIFREEAGGEMIETDSKSQIKVLENQDEQKHSSSDNLLKQGEKKDLQVEICEPENDSCIIIDEPSPDPKKESFLSFLNLKPTPTKDSKSETIDDDIIICDPDDQSQVMNLRSKSPVDKQRIKATAKVKSKVVVPVASTSKSNGKAGEETAIKKKGPSEKHIKRLEHLLERLKAKIEELREEELTLDDLADEGSSYIYEDKLERKFVAVWNKLCELKGRNCTTGRPSERSFSYSGSRYREINKRIERMVNRHKDFPDFHDIKNIIKKVNRKSSLNLNNSQVDMIARESFLDVGNILQERRHEDFMCTFRCRMKENVTFDQDPALFDPELQRKLEANRQRGRTNLEEVINKYADKQFEINGDRGEEVDAKGQRSSDEEEEEEMEEEKIEDVDQFVDDTETLTEHIRSRPAAAVSPNLTAFQVQTTEPKPQSTQTEETSHHFTQSEIVKSQSAAAEVAKSQVTQIEEHKLQITEIEDVKGQSNEAQTEKGKAPSPQTEGTKPHVIQTEEPFKSSTDAASSTLGHDKFDLESEGVRWKSIDSQEADVLSMQTEPFQPKSATTEGVTPQPATSKTVKYQLDVIHHLDLQSTNTEIDKPLPESTEAVQSHTKPQSATIVPVSENVDSGPGAAKNRSTSVTSEKCTQLSTSSHEIEATNPNPSLGVEATPQTAPSEAGKPQETEISEEFTVVQSQSKTMRESETNSTPIEIDEIQFSKMSKFPFTEPEDAGQRSSRVESLSEPPEKDEAQIAPTEKSSERREPTFIDLRSDAGVSVVAIPLFSIEGLRQTQKIGDIGSQQVKPNSGVQQRHSTVGSNQTLKTVSMSSQSNIDMVTQQTQNNVSSITQHSKSVVGISAQETQSSDAVDSRQFKKNVDVDFQQSQTQSSSTQHCKSHDIASPMRPKSPNNMSATEAQSGVSSNPAGTKSDFGAKSMESKSTASISSIRNNANTVACPSVKKSIAKPCSAASKSNINFSICSTETKADESSLHIDLVETESALPSGSKKMDTGELGARTMDETGCSPKGVDGNVKNADSSTLQDDSDDDECIITNFKEGTKKSPSVVTKKLVISSSQFDCDGIVDIQVTSGKAARKERRVREDSQNSDVEFIDMTEVVGKRPDSSVSKRPASSASRLKLPDSMKTAQESVLNNVRNRTKDLVTKALRNMEDFDKTNMSPNSSADIYDVDDMTTCSQVSTSSSHDDVICVVPTFKHSKIARHLPTHLIKEKARVDSYIIEIDEADKLDSMTYSQGDLDDWDMDDETVCESTTCETGQDVVTSTEPDVIILSDTD